MVGCKIIASRALFNPVDTRTEPFHSRILTGLGRARLLPSLFISPRLRTGSADHPSGGAPSPSRENETALRPGSPGRLPHRQRKRRDWPVLRVPESRFSPESGSFACNYLTQPAEILPVNQSIHYAEVLTTFALIHERHKPWTVRPGFSRAILH